MVAGDVISMPDKWEYPWFAAWDLAFHCAPLSLVDIDFAKQQVELLLSTRYLHPNGQIPAYEWNFSDVNPPVTAWAALFVFEREAQIRGEGDREFLGRVFERLLTNFTWWVNRKDPDDNDLFQGGFLGLDNIGIFDRWAPLPGGGTLEQADGTAWMALYCQWMLQIAVELADTTPSTPTSRSSSSATSSGSRSRSTRRAAAPRCGTRRTASTTTSCGCRTATRSGSRCARSSGCSRCARRPCSTRTSSTATRRSWSARPSSSHASPTRFPRSPTSPGPTPRAAASSASSTRGGCGGSSRAMLDEEEFLGPHGIRAISRRHLEHPCVFDWAGQRYEVHYLPAESDTGMFGGNSNWRGPVWFPMNLVILRALMQLHRYYGDRLKVECPTGSGNAVTLGEVAREIGTRLATTFTEGSDGRRPVFGGIEKFQTDPHWHDLILFHEYFHGDNGAGIGASHQTGWTGTVALLCSRSGRGDTPIADD